MRRITVASVSLLVLASVLFWSLRGKGYRRMVGEWIYTPQPGCIIEPGREFEIDYFGSRYFGNTSNLIDRIILSYGVWERSMLNFLRDVAIQLDDGELVFLDIGANSGTHSLFMARYVDKVHAFDPYKPVLKRLQRSIDASGPLNITIHPVGLGIEAAVLPFEEPPDHNRGSGSFVGGLEQGNLSRGLELQIVVGDEYFTEVGIRRVDIVKIDTEGYEKSVLKGMRKTLETSRPVVVTEMTVNSDFDGLFESVDELASAFPKNYVHLIFSYPGGYIESNEKGEYLLEPIDIDFRVAKWYNLAAIPRELSSSIALSGPADSQPAH